MSTLAYPIGTHASLTVTGLATLASATYTVSNAINLSTYTPTPADMEAIVAFTVGTVSTTAQLLAWVQVSDDGTNWTSGPTSGTTATDEPALGLSVAFPARVSSSSYRFAFSLSQLLPGGVLRKFMRIVFKNETGAALTAGTVTVAPILADVSA